MKKVICAIFLTLILFHVSQNCVFLEKTFAMSTKAYYTVYLDDNPTEILFLKGDEVEVGDKYLSSSNNLYEVVSVDVKNKTATAKFLNKETLPEFNVSSKSKKESASAASTKSVGIYHTHNDECYFTPDGTDSVYGKGGIHDVGKKLSSNFEELGYDVFYNEDLHLPHNSGAYTRSKVTASLLLNQGVDAIFDIHRDSTKRDYYLATVNGKQMSSIRMVVGSSSLNFDENKNFAYTIKSYADKVYPNLIKDIYFGKGNYNQSLSTRAMLFEMGCENIEKDLVLNSTECLAKTLDVVLFGTDGADEKSIEDVELASSNGNTEVIKGLAVSNSSATNKTLYVVLGSVGVVAIPFTLLMIFSRKSRYKVGRFFSEMFAGIFGKRKKI